ncbi:LOW QUALITY PROTEIN: tryptophan 5-hydroxylase 1-like [Lethenteron reissneri]|uniref:LOW QUALITY PROTEIN: tryptophan 5-hydroxylase 1-like n=1 Tax=Lethenteron reissneri TaxID=7753 RepID=UPI002AB7EAE7|nr:LOW QUALITY PROTEIN: tryptophan 5-hydroxylase 1-like [Lethenteron reissneri]
MFLDQVLCCNTLGRLCSFLPLCDASSRKELGSSGSRQRRCGGETLRGSPWRCQQQQQQQQRQPNGVCSSGPVSSGPHYSSAPQGDADTTGALARTLAMIEANEVKGVRLRWRGSEPLIEFCLDLQGEVSEAEAVSAGVEEAPGGGQEARATIEGAAESCGALNPLVPFPTHIFHLEEVFAAVRWDDVSSSEDFCSELDEGRRAYFSELALQYKYREPAPALQYSARESAAWRSALEAALRSAPGAEPELRAALEELTVTAYCASEVPQASHVSQLLHGHTGFSLWPVPGTPPARALLSALAFRVLPCSLHACPGSVAHPAHRTDVCGLLLGLVPLLTIGPVARAVQDMGLASLGSSNADVQLLAKSFYSVCEFALRQAGLPVCSEPGDPVGPHDVAITSLEDALSHASWQAAECTARRGWALRYEPYSQGVRTLRDPASVAQAVADLRDRLYPAYTALNELSVSGAA